MSHIIGIDLGTTNSTLAFSDKKNLEVIQFEISQRISETLEGKKKSLPSFSLFPLDHKNCCVGWYARERGAQLPDRVITSAKSWLCHDMIDRRSSFLPIGECEHKISPVEACASYLSQMRTCWNMEFPSVEFSKQSILITVPASFDPGARTLVNEAAELAGYPQVRLMEEPLAAFYAWLYAHQDDWRKTLKIGDTILVIDIGGGTTDFSLIIAEDVNGILELQRKAVGNHLLLGGDNFDVALAHYAQNKFSTPLDEWQFQSLVHACRQAKEELLSDSSPIQIDITIQGRGSRLIGGALTTQLIKEEVETILVDGFFPQIPLTEQTMQHKRSGIAKISLPYARDPRITAQLAHFLNEAKCPLPSAVLFNGGTMKAAAFQNRILSLLSSWRGEEVKNLTGNDLDYAVSSGAVCYGWALANQGLRVRAATCKSYYIGVEGGSLPIPGIQPPLKKVSIVPFGMEEGSEIELKEEQFSLILDEPAIFRFFSQNHVENQDLIELHPIETVLKSADGTGKTILVTLVSKITELGMLELWCVAENGQKWKLEFDIRNEERTM